MNPRRTTRHQNLDAAESLFLSNQLRSIRTRVYETRYPELRGRLFVPVNNDGVDETTELVENVVYTAVGMAKVIASYADDLPRVDLFATKYFSQVRTLGDAYGYDIIEVRKAARAGTDLPQRKATIARKAIENLIDSILAVGDSAHGLLGLLNQPNALSYVVPNGAGGDPSWLLKTPAEILLDMHAMAAYVVNQTKQAEIPDSMILPPTRYQYIAVTFMPDSTQTILQAFLATSPYIRNVDQWGKLETAGAGSTTRAVVYRRDPDALSATIPLEFDQLEEEKRGLEYVVDCLARMGGVVAHLPLSMCYGDDI